jgi:hypothetical protein
MEKRTQYKTASDYDQFHLRLPGDLLMWYRQRAIIERRKINEIMKAALEAYQDAQDISRIQGETK